MEHLATSVIDFVRQNQAWAVPIAFLFAFGESLAFVSLILPSTVILVAISGLLGASGISVANFFWVWVAAGFGGALGYWVSYLLGLYFKDDIDKVWPFKGRPEMLKQGREFFDKWGTLGVFLGHFFGPVRAVIPVDGRLARHAPDTLPDRQLHIRVPVGGRRAVPADVRRTVVLQLSID